MRIFISAELSKLGTKANIKRTNELRIILNYTNVLYQEARGCYKGTVERSFVVCGKYMDITSMLILAASFGQESILLVDDKQNATLQYITGKTESIGPLKTVPGPMAMSYEAWSEVNGVFLVAA